jgi:anti-anti-sigma factor
VWAKLADACFRKYGKGVAFRAALHGGDYDVFRRDELQAELAAIATDGDVDIDLKTTTFMDAGAIGLLIAFRRQLLEKQPDAHVRLLHAQPIIRRVLELSKAADLFEFAP